MNVALRSDLNLRKVSENDFHYSTIMIGKKTAKMGVMGYEVYL